MKFLILLLTVLPLALAKKPITACKCARVDCLTVNEPENCLCKNKAAIQCARLCGTVPQIKFCPFGPIIGTSLGPSITPSTASSNTSSITPTTALSNTSLTAIATPLSEPQKCGTFVPAPCPSDQSCVKNPATPDCDIRKECAGICVPPQRCGSRGLKPCPEDRSCVNDPNDPGCSTTFDCPGYCVLLDGNDCSPNFGLGCPSPQQVCVDDPSDDCFPERNAICLGKCTFLNGRSSAGFLEE